LETIMKNPTLHLCLASLLSLILLAGPAAYGQLTPSGDAYTNTAASTTNYGAKTLLDVESSQTTFIQFDLSSIPSGYTSADITKATLKLYVNAVTTAGSFNVDYVNGTWTESTIDSSNAPALGTTIAASVPLTTKDKNQYILVDVTAAVQAWLSGTANDGIALVANSPLNASFDSKESTSTSHSAELDIVFAAGSGAGITGITTAAGSGLIGGGTSGTLNLSLTNVCAASQILQWNGSAWACASPGTGTITGVTAGTDLTGGGTSGNITLNLNTTATNALYAQLAAANTFTANQMVNGTLEATSTGSAVIGNTSGSVFAAIAGGGPAIGVYGSASNTSGSGVYGAETAATGTTAGVYGTTASPDGYGVEGTSHDIGVYGQANSVSREGTDDGFSAGLWGDAGGAEDYFAVLGTADTNVAGAFLNNSPAAYAPPLYVENDTATVGATVFYATMPNLLGFDTYTTIGDPGCGETSGNYGLQLGQFGMSGCSNYTLLGNTAGSTYLNAVSGQSVHLRVANADVMKVSTGAVSITGTLSATGTKNFRIDHPLDPANKYLTHAAIESSEVLNLYSGNAILDDSGAAVVQLPDWFEAINKDFRYQLTPIGAPGRDLYVAEEISGGHFKIAGGTPGGKVSWQVTGVRNDAWEKTYPMVVEADKGADRGHYLTPELYGQPATERIGYEAVPESQQIVHHHRPNLLRGNGSPAKTITLPAPPKLIMPKPAAFPKEAPLPHPPAQAPKPEVNQK
jgi:hypothetical protein